MRVADNHCGWSIECYHTGVGWTPISVRPHATREAAQEMLDRIVPNTYEFRIYEAV